MPDIEDMTPGEVLAEASVAEFIKALGLSIAEAQRALDENSVDQIGEFIKPREGLDGKSLLDLGLSPAFYHYQHADISCSMQLSLKVERDLSVGVNLSGSFSDTSSSSESSADSSTSTESGSTSITRERSAQVEIQSASTGAVTIGGRTFNMTGSDPLARIRALQDAVTSDPQAGVPRLFYEPSDRGFTITTDAGADKVQTTDRTVAFLGGGFDRAVIQIETNTATAYKLNDSDTASATAQADLEAYATHVRDQIRALSYVAILMRPGEEYDVLNFRTGKHDIGEFALDGDRYNEHWQARVQNLAGWIKAKNLRIEIKGYADAQRYRNQGESDSAESNRQLGMRRAEELKAKFVAYGVDPGQLTTVSDGWDSARRDVRDNGGPVDNVHFRKVTIKLPEGRYWVVVDAPSDAKAIVNFDPDKRAADATGNGFAYVFHPVTLSLSGQKCTIDGTDFPFRGAAAGGHASGAPEAYAINLRDDINAKTPPVDFQASAEGNVVTVFGKTAPFRLTLFTSESRSISISGTEGISITREFTRTTSTNLTRQNTGNRTVAVGASVDVRFSRQFEMNVTGNSAISARLVSIPAPPQFLETIKDYLSRED